MKRPSSLMCKVSRAARSVQKLRTDNSHDGIFFIFCGVALVWMLSCFIIMSFFSIVPRVALLVALGGGMVLLTIGLAISEILEVHQRRARLYRENTYSEYRIYIDALRKELGISDLL